MKRIFLDGVGRQVTGPALGTGVCCPDWEWELGATDHSDGKIDDPAEVVRVEGCPATFE